MKRSGILLLLVLSLGWAAAPARADDTYTQTFDNSGSYPEITLIQGTHNAFGYLNGVRGASNSDWIEFTIDFGEEKSITSFQFDVYHEPSNSNHISFVWYQYDGTNTQVAVFSQNTQVVAPNVWHTRAAMFDSTKPTRYYKFLLWHTRTSPGALHIDNLNGVFFEETGGLGRPLAAMDESGIFSYDEQRHGLLAFSESYGANVYSITPGTVTEIKRVKVGECAELISIALPGWEELPALATDCLVSSHGLKHTLTRATYNPTMHSFSRNFTLSTYRVTITDNVGDQYIYLVEDALNYITEGDIVRQGCILGKTAQLKSFGDIELSIPLGLTFVNGDILDQGIVIVAKISSGEYESIIDEVVVYPTQETACNVREEFRECLGDGALESTSNWQTFGTVTELDPGFLIGFNSRISKTYNLDANRLPRLRIQARALGGTANVKLKLGQTEQTVSVGAIEAEYRIDADEHDPDAGLFFTVTIQNLSSTTIQLDWACVSHFLTEDMEEREDQPPNCYFGNTSFTDSTVWASAGNVYAYPGEYRMDSGALIYQPVKLYPGDYVISVTASLWHYNTYLIDETDVSTDITLEYDWPQDATYSLIESATIADLAAWGNVYTFTAQFNVASTDEGQFAIRPTLSSTPTGVRGIAIREVCLNPVGDGWPPNPDGPPGGGEPEGPFNENCTPNPRPSGEAISSWLTWHWLNFRGFFSCELMILLNDMYKLGVNTYKLIGWTARWSQSSVMIGADWISTDAIYWAEGHFANMALGRETFIQVNESQNCSNLWCAIGALFGTVDGIFDNLADVIQSVLENVFGPLIAFIINLVNTTIGFVFSLIIALINIGIYLISLLITAVARVLSLFTGLIDAWNNAEPEPIPGLPSCYYDPRQSGFCMVLHGMEQTIFSGRGALLIPLLIGFGSIHMLLWTIKEFKHTLLETGKAL